MTEELEQFIGALNIVVYTLVDGSRVIGEERDYDYTNGIVTTYGVLEFHQFNKISTLSPYVPEAIDTEFVFTDRNIIGRCNATFELKRIYYDALISGKLKQVLSEEEYNKYLKIQKKPSSTLESWDGLLGDGDNPFSRN